MSSPDDDTRLALLAAKVLATDEPPAAGIGLGQRAADLAALERELRARARGRRRAWPAVAGLAAAAGVAVFVAWQRSEPAREPVARTAAPDAKRPPPLSIALLEGAGASIELAGGVRPVTLGEGMVAGTRLGVPPGGGVTLSMATGTRIDVGGGPLSASPSSATSSGSSSPAAPWPPRSPSSIPDGGSSSRRRTRRSRSKAHGSRSRLDAIRRPAIRLSAPAWKYRRASWRSGTRRPSSASRREVAGPIASPRPWFLVPSPSGITRSRGRLRGRTSRRRHRRRCPRPSRFPLPRSRSRTICLRRPLRPAVAVTSTKGFTGSIA